MLQRRPFVKAVIAHRVAAATEHLSAIEMCGANTLLDAGANTGQFSLAFRTLRPHAQIIAFEPLPKAAETFEKLFKGDALTELQRVALAEDAGISEFHVADRADSSSLLKPGAGQELAFGVREANTVRVTRKRLDACVEFSELRHPVLLKVDVQGGEQGVFNGCDQLSKVDYIYVELSFVELYLGQPLFEDVVDYLQTRQFRIIGFFNQVVTEEYGPTQVDVLFQRRTPEDFV
ncbi:FkbM family methyltransferase [Mycolicibacterium parafortuitum]|uniref:FkbM family methyltransferase n=1 Tax=Mycolicibacterium parafortuitum TaxID=39692 RepID=UPI0032C3EC55